MNLTSNEVIDAVRKSLTDKTGNILDSLSLPRFLDDGIYEVGMYCSVVSAHGLENWIFLDNKINETVIDKDNSDFTIKAIRVNDGLISKISMYDVLPAKIGISTCNKDKKEIIQSFGKTLDKQIEKNIVEDYLQKMQEPVRKPHRNRR